MFPSDRGIALEGGRLRSGNRFWSGKIRRAVTRSGSCSMNRGQEFEFTSHIDGDSSKDEEEYHTIPEREETGKESLDLKYKYDIPMTSRTSSEVRSRDLSPSRFVNTSNINCGNSRQGSPSSQTFYPAVPRTNIMARNDIKLLIFN